MYEVWILTMTGQGRRCCTNSPTVLYSVLENFIKTHVSYKIKQDLDLDAHRRSGQNVSTSSMEAAARSLKYGDVVKEEWCRCDSTSVVAIPQVWRELSKHHFCMIDVSKNRFPDLSLFLFISPLTYIHYEVFLYWSNSLSSLKVLFLSNEVPIHRNFMHLA